MLPTITYRTRSNRPVVRRRSHLDTDFDRLFDGFFGPSFRSGFVTRAHAAANLYETDNQLVLELEVPGFRKDGIEVTVERGVLTVSGSHEEETEQGGEAGASEGGQPVFHVRERSFERFSRSFSLPESVSSEDVVAELEDGVLTVRLPKAAEAKPRRVEISAK